MQDLEKEVMAVLNQIQDRVSDALDTSAEKVGKEAAEKLKQTSPKNSKSPRGGRYAKGWAVKHSKKGETVVYNKTDYQLTHLLEKGHDIVRSGQKVGHAKAIPHIKPVEEWVQNEFPEELARQVKI